MSLPLLTLGNFTFDGLEVPDKIQQTTKQRIVVHHLGSGLTIADNMGIEREVVTFRGIFNGAWAADRISALDYLRQQKIPQTLAWGPNAVSVVIQVLELDYLSPVWVPYRISCYVLPSINPIASTSNDVLSTSPAAATSDILTLLQGSTLTADVGQITAIGTLAALNFDVPPPGALAQARALAASIDGTLSTLNLALLTGSPEGLDASDKMSAATAVNGQDSALVLARNRVMGIVLTSECPE